MRRAFTMVLFFSLILTASAVFAVSEPCREIFFQNTFVGNEFIGSQDDPDRGMLTATAAVTTPQMSGTFSWATGGGSFSGIKVKNITTFTHWGLLLLALALVGSALWMLKRKRTG